MHDEGVSEREAPDAATVEAIAKNKYYDEETPEMKSLNERLERPESYESNVIYNTYKKWYARDASIEDTTQSRL